jgi:hypothetical protein
MPLDFLYTVTEQGVAYNKALDDHAPYMKPGEWGILAPRGSILGALIFSPTGMKMTLSDIQNAIVSRGEYHNREKTDEALAWLVKHGCINFEGRVIRDCRC